MGIKKLTAENAIIKTASVEVKTLTISGKQVTLAVFRQLPIKHIISDESYDLLGIPWGRVNYSLPDKPYGEHLQLVWQEGQILYRCWVTAKFMDWQELEAEIRDLNNQISARYQTILICALAEQVPIKFDRKSRETRFNLNGWSFRVYALDGGRYSTLNLDHCLSRDESYINKQDSWNKEGGGWIYKPRSEEELAEYRNKAIEEYSKKCNDNYGGDWNYTDWSGKVLCDSLQEEKASLEAKGAELELCRKKWGEHYQLFESLDQLYIAV